MGMIRLSLLWFLPTGCAPGETSEHLTFEEGIEAVSVVLDAGSVHAGVADAVSVERVVRGHASAVREGVEDGVLHLEARCDSLLPCDVDLVLGIPAGVELDIRTGSGDVNLRGLDADVHLEVGDGDVDARDLRLGSLHVRAGWGDVALGFATPPSDLLVRLDVGNVTARVPGGAYDLDVASLAEPELSGVVDARGGGRVHIRTTSGRARVLGILAEAR